MDPIFGTSLEDVCHIVFIMLYLTKSILHIRPVIKSEVGWYTSGFV